MTTENFVHMTGAELHRYVARDPETVAAIQARLARAHERAELVARSKANSQAEREGQAAERAKVMGS